MFINKYNTVSDTNSILFSSISTCNIQFDKCIFQKTQVKTQIQAQLLFHAFSLWHIIPKCTFSIGILSPNQLRAECEGSQVTQHPY